MMRRIAALMVLVAVGSGILVGSSLVAPKDASALTVALIFAPGPPPPPAVEVVGVRPGPGWVWVAGHWVWRSRWVWVRGYWARVPVGYAVWVPGHWDRRARGWVWVEGRWR